jgi:hypothetical protein
MPPELAGEEACQSEACEYTDDDARADQDYLFVEDQLQFALPSAEGHADANIVRHPISLRNFPKVSSEAFRSRLATTRPESHFTISRKLVSSNLAN